MPVFEIKRCRRCDAVVSDSTLGGLCPVCLLERSIEEDGPELEPGETGNVLPEPAQSFGDFELIEEIARGGMGVVYRARQRGLDRVVALKIIIGGPWATPALRERFLLEARTVAKLDHPNIVPVFDYGEHAGHAFLSLRLIEGGTLAGALEAGRFSLPGGTPPGAIARFFCHVADAVHHAHQRGVLHRDIKPSNILIDTDGRPLVTDFGLAKLRDLESSLTHSSAVLGTPSYMAPEQASGKSSEVTVAADIYGLGAVLYEMLTGRPPFVGASPLQTIQQVADHQLTPPGRLNPDVPRDLGIICAKCLRWQPEDRYTSADDLEHDLQRWLNHEPIEARSITRFERVGYWVRRRPAVASLSFVVVLLLITGIVLGSNQALKLHHARIAAEDSAAESRNRLQQLYLQNWQSELQKGNSLRSLPWLLENMKLTEPGSRAMRLNEQRLRSVVARSPTLEQMWFTGSMVEEISVSPDGKLLAAGRYGGEVFVWNADTGVPAFPAIQHTNYVYDADGYTAGYLFIWNVGFSPDGRQLLTAVNHDAFLWDTRTGRQIGESFPHPNKVWQTTFGPKGKRIATVGLDRHARIFQIDNHELLFKSPKHSSAILAVDFSPDGTSLATGGRDGVARIFDLKNKSERSSSLKHSGHITQVAFHPSGKMLATASKDGTAGLWDFATGESRLLPHEGAVNSVAFSPDGALLVTASVDGATRVWNVGTGRIHTRALRHPLPANQAVFDPDAELVLSISDDGHARAARVSDGQELPWAAPHNHHLTDVEFFPDGKRFATASANGVVKIFKMPSGSNSPGIVANPGLAGKDWEISNSKSGRMTFRLNGQIVAEHDSPTPRLFKAIPDAQRKQVYLIDAGFEGHVWDLAGNQLRPFRWATNQCLETAAFTSDGGRMLLNFTPKEVVLWDLERDELLPFRSRHNRMVNHVTISPDDQYFATASDEPGARIWRVADGEPTSPVLAHADFASVVVFSPDGTLLASAGLDGQVKLWTVPEGRSWQNPLVHAEPVGQLYFSPSGDHLATVTDKNEVRVWRVADGAQLTPGFGHDDAIRSVQFLDDERLVQTTTLTGFRSVWDVESDCIVTLATRDLEGPVNKEGGRKTTGLMGDLAAIENEIQLISGARIGADGDLQRIDPEVLEKLWENRPSTDSIWAAPALVE